MRPGCLSLLVICLSAAVARRQHDSQKHKHAHTYLAFCSDDTTVSPAACISKVGKRWPTPATLDALDCKEAAPPHATVGTAVASCAAGGLSSKNWFEPITIAQGLHQPTTDYRQGADVDTLTDWDRIRCRDGQLFATGCTLSNPTRLTSRLRTGPSRWYRKYTPQECSRLCSKVSNFYGKSCTHFSRQWIQTQIEEHSDACGRDGDRYAPDAAMPKHGAYGSAGVGTGSYSFKGQCIFFSSQNEHCCATKARWTKDTGNGAASNYCGDKYGALKDSWDSKHRSWTKTADSNFSPSSAWPVTSAGRRLEEQLPEGLSGDEPHVHELIFGNGTSMWAIEEPDPGAAINGTLAR